MTESELFIKLKGLTHRLSLIVEERGSLFDPGVVSISQEMDVIVTHLQRMKMNRFY